MNNNHEFIELFEQKLCEFTGAPYAVAVDSCTNAILLSLEAKELSTLNERLVIPKQTYLSVPMTLMNYGYNISFTDHNWYGKYAIGNTNIWDCAQTFIKDMYEKGSIQCLSFQQKKRLAIGRGGAILLDNEELANKLRRLRHDGRDSSMPVVNENPEDIIMGYHMHMTPDEAAKGLLLLNQLQDYKMGSYEDYPDLTTMGCFK